MTKFIAFTGAKGSGKSTIIKEVSKCLKDKGLNVYIWNANNPSSSYWKVLLSLREKIISDGLRPEGIDLYAHFIELLCSYQDRKSELHSYDFVLVDRYFYDKYMFGALRYSEYTAELKSIYDLCCNVLPLDSTIYIEASFDNIRTRLLTRGRAAEYTSNQLLVYTEEETVILGIIKALEENYTAGRIPSCVKVNNDGGLENTIQKVLKVILGR